VSDEATVRADDRAHVFHSWSAQGLIDPMPIAGAEGSTFWDYAGKRYLDFSSQLVNVNIGHQHPRLVAAIQEQAARLCTVSPSFANDKRGEAARLIAELAPGDLNRVFFTNGGAEANENAIRMARIHTGRHKVLAMYRSYHGATAAAITATGDPRRWANEPTAVGMVHFWGPYPYRSAFHATDEAQESQRALAHLRENIVFEGPSTVAAVLLETVVGTNGVLVPPSGYLAGVREICDEFGIVLIADEVMAGFGRCGEWFAVDHWNVTPDLITFAKGVNSGYLPLGGSSSPTDRGDVPGAGVPRRADLLGPSSCVRLRGRVDPDLQGGGHRRVRPPARRGGHRPDPARPGDPAPERRRGARPRCVLGTRARQGPRHARAAGAVQRVRRGRGADE
jgi:taurine--2-oxoglutarate transaminase